VTIAARALALVLAALAGACTLAPRYRAPAMPPVAAYREAGNWMPAVPADTKPRGAWWEAFGDAKLDELEVRVRDGSPDLRAAVARFEQGRAIALGARSRLFPAVTATASATRTRTSANAPRSGGVNATGNDYLAGLDLSWEVDLLGRLRSGARAARARAEASAADLAAVDLAVRAELATDYFSLRGADATGKLLADSIEAYDHALALTKNRYHGGIAAATDVDQAETQLENARAELASVELDRAQLEHAIAVLLGVPPGGFSLEPAPFAGEPPPLDPGLPSTLLERRPDVASAERTVAAANAGIGAARAAWFPVFAFGGAGGYEATSTPAWFDAPSRFWSAGPAAALPLLDAGTRFAATHAARAAYDEAVANYRQVALTAYREVEDNLAALHYLTNAAQADEAAAASAQRSAYHADQRYAAGVADYLEVTSTHTAALAARRAALEARVRRMNAAVGLVRALGGGWTPAGLDRPAL
jgi:NodT family efflux transporter outer membrane factor (OMF) lipoprotein